MLFIVSSFLFFLLLRYLFSHNLIISLFRFYFFLFLFSFFIHFIDAMVNLTYNMQLPWHNGIFLVTIPIILNKSFLNGSYRMHFVLQHTLMPDLSSCAHGALHLHRLRWSPSVAFFCFFAVDEVFILIYLVLKMLSMMRFETRMHFISFNLYIFNGILLIILFLVVFISLNYIVIIIFIPFLFLSRYHFIAPSDIGIKFSIIFSVCYLIWFLLLSQPLASSLLWR